MLNAYCGMHHRRVCAGMRNGLNAYCGTFHCNVCGAVVDQLETQKVATQKAVPKVSVCTLFFNGRHVHVTIAGTRWASEERAHGAMLGEFSIARAAI